MGYWQESLFVRAWGREGRLFVDIDQWQEQKMKKILNLFYNSVHFKCIFVEAYSENDNEYNRSAIAYFQAVKKWLVIFRRELLKFLFHLWNIGKYLEIKVEILGKKIAAAAGTWVLGGGIEIPAIS